MKRESKWRRIRGREDGVRVSRKDLELGIYGRGKVRRRW
jgi:hypothetical protein